MKRKWFKIRSLIWNKTLFKYDLGGFKIRITENHIIIKSKSSNFMLKMSNTTYTWGYLLTSANQKLDGNIEGFAKLMYTVGSIVCSEQAFFDDIRKSIAKYNRRMEKKASAIAKSITKEEDKINESVIEDNISYAKMNRKERKAHKESIREVLTKEDVE